MQPAAVVAYPQASGFTRITDYSRLPPQKGHGTSYAIEYPLAGSDEDSAPPYYPVLTAESIAMYNKYLTATQNIPNLFLCGRLADFKYYNMDQALERALETAKFVMNRAS
jgi:UDP-galactopyranose mutase